MVTLHSPVEHDLYGRTLKEALAWCLVWLMVPELGIGPFLARRTWSPCWSVARSGTTESPDTRATMPARRLMLGLLVAGALLVGTTSPSPVAAQSCDPAYVSHCIPPVADIGDLNCQWLYDQGISGIVLAAPLTIRMVSTAPTPSTTGTAARGIPRKTPTSWQARRALSPRR